VAFDGGTKKAQLSHLFQNIFFIMFIAVSILYNDVSNLLRQRVRDSPSTRGSIRSWQYECAVSCIASSSSVKRFAEFSGSSQLNTAGA
jgi:hypothetical protein